MEQLVPDLITFLLTHPEIKSLKQVSNTNMFLLCHLHTCLFNSPCLCKIASLMKYVDIALTAPARFCMASAVCVYLSSSLACQQNSAVHKHEQKAG